MPKSKSLTSFVTHIGTYAELASYARAFADGHLNLLLVSGDPGLGKSRQMRESIGDHACWIDGNASPFQIYCEAYKSRGLPLILDDVDGLYRNPAGIRLLKNLAQTEPVKHVSWQTAAPGLDRLKIPREFTTASQVAVIVNDWRTLNADVAALEDRGHLLSFEPSPGEIHRHAARWFWDQEVFDFIAERLHLVERHSLRTYTKAYELKVAGFDWRSTILSRLVPPAALAVAKLKADPVFATEEDRVRAFIQAGLGCRATFYNQAKRLVLAEPIETIVLANKEPPLPPDQVADISEILKRRGGLGNG